jgi:hypothetical protein
MVAPQHASRAGVAIARRHTFRQIIAGSRLRVSTLTLVAGVKVEDIDLGPVRAATQDIKTAAHLRAARAQGDRTALGDQA